MNGDGVLSCAREMWGNDRLLVALSNGLFQLCECKVIL